MAMTAMAAMTAVMAVMAVIVPGVVTGRIAGVSTQRRA